MSLRCTVYIGIKSFTVCHFKYSFTKVPCIRKVPTGIEIQVKIIFPHIIEVKVHSCRLLQTKFKNSWKYLFSSASVLIDCSNSATLNVCSDLLTQAPKLFSLLTYKNWQIYICAFYICVGVFVCACVRACTCMNVQSGN